MDTTHLASASRDRSLLKMLSDGTAGAGTRLMASLSAGLLVAAVSCVACYILSSWFPQPRTPVPSTGGRMTIYVSDSVAAVVFLFAATLYVAVLFWIWSRHRRKRVLWLGGAMTVGIGLVAILLGILVDIWFSGDEEFLICGIVLAAIGLALAGWTRLYHRHVGGRALFDESGVLALQCPSCGYSMVGLKEARCPECGQEYTLNDLMARQDFEALRLSRVLRGTARESPEVAQAGEPKM
jgi:hypothetical protein